ncbi:MAG: UDP-N-acetylglucosamine 2-epimerase (non-hydrolyzing) [Flavobacteriales bacterium]|nr:UDP-N-acetylglucosamine 2-epimerase (non-hydrolyzing) [Flavobacteriales bacterium]
MKKILFLFGTRPEAIKMAPLIKTFKGSKKFIVKVGVTAQHRQMLDQVLCFFDIQPDYDLNIMHPNQTLHQLTADLISRITKEILLKEKFDLVFIQGDTTTVLAGALASFYQKIDIAHLEAGLRSQDIYSPFPEEMNRVLVSRISKFHFCPTPKSANNIKIENIKENIFEVGNTVIDALLLGVEKINSLNQQLFEEKFPNVDFSKKIILITAHRRENFGEPFVEICESIQEIAKKYSEKVQIVYPVHLNPNIKNNAHKYLNTPNIHLIEPLDYPYLIWIMNKSYLVLTDSGGIQEEAPSLGKPVLVLREVTERSEGIDAGTARLVGTNKNLIITETIKLLENKEYYQKIANIHNPYGDGTTSKQILKVVEEYYN